MKTTTGFAGIMVLLMLSLGGCTKSAPTLTRQEAELIAAVRMDAALALKIKSFGASLERLLAMNENGDELPADGIILDTKPKAGREVLDKVRRALAGTAYHAYLRENAFGYGPDKIAVTPAGDLGYLAIVRTDGVNYDIGHEQVMERYKEWDGKYGLKLIGAGLDWLEAEFRTPPADWQAFAKEVYAFCPDVVDQGTGDVGSLAREMKSSNTVYLWWD